MTTDASAMVPTTEEPMVLARVTGLSKAFGATQALRGASLEVRAGEVHTLVGENGSGKSTLVKILSGVHAPDAGTIELRGEEISAPPTPRAAQELGIVTVFQEILVSEARSVLDNVWLGMDGLFRNRIPRREKRERAREALGELTGRRPNLDTPVEALSLSDRQSVGIVRALMRRPSVLILDEATSALDVATRDRLFGIVRRLSGDGVGVIFISHRMDEISEIGGRITVARSGETVATLEQDEWTPRQLVQLMTGADQLTEHAREEAGGAVKRRGATVLSVRGLTLRPACKPIDVEVRAGELIGLAGLEGHGQEEFLDALRGSVAAAAGTVVRHRDGVEIAFHSPRQAAKERIAYVPRERRQALFAWMSVRENFGLPTLDQDRRSGWLVPSATRRRLAMYVDELGIMLGRPDDPITTLSGGNQQKVVIARWLAAAPKVLLLNDPTRGIDVGAKRDLYALLVRLAKEQMAVVMLSSELDEHVELMDRVLVFREHELAAEIERSTISRQALLSGFFGEEGDRVDS
jgi:ABC-type sugar transport system ATPase subunit